jgi:uncharacterized membrane protein YraQ (UPF0718 family)
VKNLFSVLVATFADIPMYADIFETLPIAEALVAKGVGIGTVLAFMMAVTALSLPSMFLLKKVVKKRTHAGSFFVDEIPYIPPPPLLAIISGLIIPKIMAT